MIVVEHLRKVYGQTTAVDDLSFQIEKGHIYGFLGPNGAGKSTTMNMITGCLAATSGTVTIDGLDIFNDSKAAKKKIGYLPEIPPLYMDQTPDEYLYFVAEAKGVKKEEIGKQIDEAEKMCGIEEVKDRLISHLSKGYRQRVGIAQALIGNPEIIILDEPTVGLDPLQIIEIRDLIRELGKNHTVILSSHILTEINMVCEKVLIVSKGKMVAFDTPENLELQRKDHSALYIRPQDLDAAQETVKRLDCVESFTVEENGLKLYTKGNMDEAAKELFFAFASENNALYEMRIRKADLESVFIELTEQKDEVEE